MADTEKSFHYHHHRREESEGGWHAWKRIMLHKRILSLQLCVQTEIRSPHISDKGAACLDCEGIEGRYLLCGGGDGRVSLFDLNNHTPASSRADKIRCKNIISCSALSSNTTGTVQRISCVQWYPTDTGLFVSGSMDGLVRIWDTNAFKVAAEFRIDDRVYSARMSADSR